MNRRDRDRLTTQGERLMALLYGVGVVLATAAFVLIALAIDSLAEALIY